MENSNTEIIRGHADTIILRVLEQRDSYAYEILSLIGNASDGRYSIKQPTLYSCLKRLEKQGFISSYYGDDGESGGGRRRYYTLTQKGIATLNQDQREWEYSRTILDKLLSDKQVDLETVDAPFNANNLRPYTKRVKAYDILEKSDSPSSAVITPKDDANFKEDDKSTSSNSSPCDKSLAFEEEQPKQEVKEDFSKSEQVTQKPAETIDILEPQEKNAQLEYLRAQEEARLAVLKKQEEERLERERIAADLAEKARLEEEAKAAEIKRRQEEAARKLQLGVYQPYVDPDAKRETVSTKPFQQANSIYRHTEPTPEQIYANQMLFSGVMPQKNRISEVVNLDRDNFGYSANGSLQAKRTPNEDYRKALSEVFSSTSSSGSTNNQTSDAKFIHHSAVAEIEAREAAAGLDNIPYSDDRPGNGKMFYDTCKKIEDDGFKVKHYSAPNSANYYYMKYVYTNRILRDTLALTYVVLAILVLILYLAKSTFGYSNTALLVITSVGLLIPIVPTVAWIINPAKRSKANFNFAISMKNACIAFMLVATIATIINLVSPSVSIAAGKFYVPYLLCLIIPASVGIYALLYKSGNYHIK